MRKVFALVLALVMSVPAMTGLAATGGRLEGVDYTRIEENASLEKEVTFLIGDRKFTGVLSNGKTLTAEEIDSIIRGVMTSQKITSGMLIGAQRRATEALQYNAERYVQGTVLAELVLATAGIDSAQELSQILLGDSAIPTDEKFYIDVLTNTALAKLFDIALGATVGKTFSGLIGAAQNVGQIASREYFEYIRDNERVQQALAGALALERFYALCNAAIKKAERERGLDQWSLKCAQTVWTKKTLFGSIPVMQYWRLTCDLKRANTTKDATNWGGTYTGPIKLEVWHDMSSFDEQFYSRFYLGSQFPFHKEAAFFDMSDRYSQPSTLTKTLENPGFSIALDPGMAESGEFTKPFSFSGFEDRSFFWSLHPIHGGFKGAGMKDGELTITGPYFYVNNKAKIDRSFVGEMNTDNMGIHVDIYGWNITNVSTATAPRTHIHRDLSEGGMDRATLATDNTVYEDLRIIPTITINGV